MNQFGLFSLVVASIIYADGTFKNFKSEKIIQVGNTFENFQTKYLKSISGSEFFANQQWNSYEPLPINKLYTKNKPKIISSQRERKIKAVGPKIRIVISKKKKYDKVNIKLVKKDIVIDFFSTALSFSVPDRLKEAKFYPQTQKGIGDFFNQVSYTEYNYLINDIEEVKKEMNLNDWGLYLLISEVSKKIFTNEDERKLFSWFVLNKMGYSVRAGISKKHIILVFKTKQSVNYTLSYKINGDIFYVLDSKFDKDSVIYTYASDVPNADKAFDLSLDVLPNFELYIQSKDLVFKIDGKEYTLVYKYNQNLIDFMATYPQVQSDVFLNAPLDDISYQSIGMSLKEYVDREKASTAINFVLHFVQNAFKYQSDMEQFKKEKFMFAQETLYYNKSDAEDRVSLFSYLIRKFFSFGVIGITYNNHMVAGLYIPLVGDGVVYKKRKYVIA
ncbi:MAG: hypothetical protein ABGW74_05270, partial [Campylobacterales bacterium]